MTVSAETVVICDRPFDELVTVLGRIVEGLTRDYPKFRIVEATDDRAVLVTRMGFRSRGETVTLSVEEKSIRIVSRCKPFQIIDWGKNSENVALIRGYLVNRLR